MKKIFIIHGWEESPEELLFKWLAKQLKERDFEVHVLKMPNPSNPKIDDWVSFLQEKVKPLNEETFFIAHSIGCQALLRYFTILPPEDRVGGAILIAPWTKLKNLSAKEEKIAKPWLEIPLNWKSAADQTSNFVAIFSDNDKYVPLSEKEVFKKNLGARIIVEPKKGHFTEDDGVTELASALLELLELAK
ncbi:MAG: alpha/beta hydrolase [Nanoarchaeota archaeon]|nr:alpha/beta hydrolase [Nanoarchaeota archaeon]MBU0977920.1 alpha/beta hydrolase [Nanoarchaeota archaeon]